MPSKSTRQIVEESNRVGVQFLMAETLVGLTFLDVSNTTGSDETRARNRQLALTAYETVLRLLPKVTPRGEEREALQTKLVELRRRLIDLGCLEAASPFPPENCI